MGTDALPDFDGTMQSLLMCILRGLRPTSSSSAADKAGDICAYRIPQDVAIDLAVVVNEPITHTNDLYPLHAQCFCARFFGHMRSCVTHYLQSVCNGVLRDPRFVKFGACQSRRERMCVL